MYARDAEYSSNNWNLSVGLEQPPRLTNDLKLDTKDALGVSKINIFWDNLSKIEKDTVVKSLRQWLVNLGYSEREKSNLKMNY